MDKNAKMHSNVGTKDPELVAEKLKEIIVILTSKMSEEAQIRSYPKIILKLKNLSPLEMSKKKTHGGAPIGASIALIKNVLNGAEPYFIHRVIEELSKIL